jgi:hypothetical protein
VPDRRRGLAFGLILAITAATAASLATSSGAVRHEGGTRPGPWCGDARWRLATLSDVDRGRVRFNRIETDIAGLADLKPPATIGLRRTSDFQRHSWRLRVVVDRYRIGSNGEIVLVLYSIPNAAYMDAYLPNPHCLGARTRDRTGILAARREFTDHCPHATAAWQLLGASVDISGIGYWNPIHTTRGALPNGAELRPLTNLTIVSGCGIASR